MRPDRSALITGVTGQDGAYLARSLLEQGFTVHGGFRRGGSRKIWRLEALGILGRVHMTELEITEFQNVLSVVQEVKPDLVFNLAAQSFVADSFKYPAFTTNVNSIGVLNVLEALRLAAPDASLFHASTSEMFGGPPDTPLDENTALRSGNPYAISKVYAHLMVRNYRETYGMRCGSGILFNHESPLRGREFVTRKIAFNMARLKVEGGDPVHLGNLDAARDWGAAEDYVVAMQKMTSAARVEDYVIATGSRTTVRNFLAMAAQCAGFHPTFEGTGRIEVCVDRKSGKTLAVVDEKYFREHDTGALIGDAGKIERELGWKPTLDLSQIVEEMVAEDVDRWKRGFTNV